jgi:nucleotide-binding universal stress UspA family protein
MKAIDKIGADLVVMASHKPGFLEHIFSSHGGYIAQHATCSVFVVR